MKRAIRKTAYVLLLTLSASLLFGCGGGTTTSGSAFDSSHGGYYEVYGNVEVCVGSYCDSDFVSGLVVHVSTTGRVTETADFAPYCSSSNESQSNTWNISQPVQKESTLVDDVLTAMMVNSTSIPADITLLGPTRLDAVHLEFLDRVPAVEGEVGEPRFG